MDETKRAVYHGLVQAKLLMEEASAEANHAAAIASNLRLLLSRGGMDLDQVAADLDRVQNSVRRTWKCTNEAFALIKVA